jgi:hypothetical protein
MTDLLLQVSVAISALGAIVSVVATLWARQRERRLQLALKSKEGRLKESKSTEEYSITTGNEDNTEASER